MLLARVFSPLSRGMVSRARKATTSDECQFFVVDSGVSRHMCCDKSMFSTLSLGSEEYVLLGDDTTIAARGVGTIKMKL